MKTGMKPGAIVVLHILLAVATCWSQDLSLYGEVTKKLKGKDIPAAGFKIVLIKGDKESAPAYTSRTGKYGIYVLPGPLGQFTLRIYNGDDLVRSYEVLVDKKPTRFDIKLP
jgi:hypothetical protein